MKTYSEQAPATAPEAGQPDGEASASRAAVLEAVMTEVARISAFPRTALTEDQRLAVELGFDSLMLYHLASTLQAALPDHRVPADLVQDGLTIGGLTAMIAGPADGRPSPPAGIPAEPAAPAVWDESSADISAFPEVQALESRYRQVASLGLPIPYFRPHQHTVANTTTVDDQRRISFGSYNYLGLSGHPVVNAAVHAAVDRYGSSVSGSRMLSGDRPLLQDLERELAGLLGTEDCLALVSGHATNVGAIGHLVSEGDLILHDALAHDSILQGCALSGARRQPFPHNDLGRLESILRQTRAEFRRVLIVVEGVYSMDGDMVDLPPLIELKKRYGALLMIDEAHSIGTVGHGGGGVGEHYGVDRADVDLWMGTLSKSLASCGGYLAGSARTVNWLRYTLPGFVYSVGMTPANAAAALAAVQLIRAEPQRLAALRANSELFLGLARTAGIPTGTSAGTPIVPCIVGDSARTLRMAKGLFDRGIVVDPILYPAVDERETRLRFFVTSEHAEYEIRYAVAALAEELRGGA